MERRRLPAQFGYFFPVKGSQACFNLRGYYEFAAENRPSG
jgi:hypothetical protein